MEREKALTRFRVRDFASGTEHHIAMDEPVYTVRWAGTRSSTPARCATSTRRFVTPSTVYDYEMSTKKRELKKRQMCSAGTIRRSTLPSDMGQGARWRHGSRLAGLSRRS